MKIQNLLIMLLVSYLIGSIPSAVWVGRIFYKKDVRKLGSGNAGATNVYRVLGIFPAIIVFLIDAAKGAVAIWICLHFRIAFPWITLAAFFVLLGHIFPLYAGFSGGKGVSTAAGILVVISPIPLVPALLVFFIVVWRFRIVSIASILAAATAFGAAFVQSCCFTGSRTSVAVTLLFFILILISHRKNISRLISGRELRF